jgi:hypothetical protein
MPFAANASFWGDASERNVFSGMVYAYKLQNFDEGSYRNGVAWTFDTFEQHTGKKLTPGEKHRVGIKVYTDSGDGIQTPLPLVRAVIEELCKRGYAKKDLFIVDAYESKLRETGYLPPLSTRQPDELFDGVEVRYLSSDRWWNKTWFYDNPLPADTSTMGKEALAKHDAMGGESRKSFLVASFIEDVDFWIDMPVVKDNYAMEVSGSLANATIWNVSNRERFFNSQANAPVAMAEIAAIPEYLDNWALSIVSMERFQIVGGPIFNSNYMRSDPVLLSSTDPAILDAWAAKRINAYRVSMGFKPLNSPPFCVSFARMLNLGTAEVPNIMWITPDNQPPERYVLDPERIDNNPTDRPRTDSGLNIPDIPIATPNRKR